ncbi:MAG: twin-arginine translocase TatA/TatE family subunit [Flavobacteriales bacterium]|jgi:sec-independent protein translocase protein TatA|nr:twin-arginine translocase TatA/TatE family subunit [Flavobacteriales bacterium]MBK7556586.1 twin-arginine translocase TatA/TatE family subunit [Flavobacteriales bacterium]MBK9193869.1 twin-arginine translocase TatA/TatE family subunit [Flavobacteriales bacterium]
MGIGFKEILVIALIVVILFGAKRIPELMKGLGRGIKDFKDASKGEEPSKETSKEEVK